jgi:hypothetical protein
MTEVSEEINRSDTICHYKRFYGFLRANCNAYRVGFPKMVDLLRLFAEYGLTALAHWPDAATCRPGAHTGDIPRACPLQPDLLSPFCS